MAGIADQLGGLAGMGDGAETSSRSPDFSVSVVSSGNGGGGLGGLLGDVASFLGMDGGGADPWKETTVSLQVAQVAAPDIDTAELVTLDDGSAPAVSPGDTISISLGFADSGVLQVYSGKVESVGFEGLNRRRIVVTGASSALSRIRVNQAYNSVTCGDIVNDLAGRAGCTAGSIEDGISLAGFVVDDRVSAWAHIARLALLSGCWAWCGSDGAINFKSVSPGSAAAVFTYGSDAVTVKRFESAPLLGSMELVGDGAASTKGKGAWYWPVKNVSSLKTSVADGGGRALFVAGLRDAASVKQAGMSLSARDEQQSVRGTMRAPGNEAIAIGDTIELAAFPQPAVNGTGLVQGVRHWYTKQSGFVTEIDFCKAASGGAAGSALPF